MLLGRGQQPLDWPAPLPTALFCNTSPGETLAVALIQLLLHWCVFILSDLVGFAWLMTKISSLSTFISTPGFQWHWLEQVFISWHCLLNSLCSGVGFLWFCWQNRNHGVGLEFCLVWVFCFLFFFFSSRVCERNISYFYNKRSEDELSMQGLCLYEGIKWKCYTSRTIQWLVSGRGIWHFKKIKV